MLQKIAKLITNNFGLKVLAVIVAVIFWLIIVNVEDPERTRVFSVPVTIENADYLEDMGKTYEVLNDSDTITFTVTAQRSVIERMDAEDFVAVANMQDIVNMSQIPITITAQKYANQLTINQRTQYVELNVENVVSKTFDIKMDEEGTPPKGYSLSESSLAPESVEVTGPESVVNSIKTASVQVKLNSLKGDSQQTAEIMLYDSSGNKVSKDRLTLSSNKVTISMGVLQQKTVPVNYETSGKLEDGYRLKGISGTPESVKIQGRPETLKGIESILVRGNALNITGLRADKTIELNLEDYLPEGVTLAQGQDGTASVEIEIEASAERTFEVPSSNIDLINIPEGYQAAALDDTVKVSLTGFAGDLDKISAGDITGSADLSDLKEGTQTVDVTLTGDYDIAETPVIRVTLTREESRDPGNAGDNTDTDPNAE